MMIKRLSTSRIFAVNNPIDAVEDIAEKQKWIATRLGSDELVIETPGNWGSYHMTWVWVENLQTLGFNVACELHKDLPAGEDTLEKKARLYELLSLVNDQLWVGHFNLNEEGMPTYRYTLLLGEDLEQCPRHIEDIIEIAVGEWERFYPAFLAVLQDNLLPKDAMAVALFNTVGEA